MELVVLARFTLGLLFATALVAKVARPRRFLDAVRTYPVLRGSLGAAAAALVGLSELGVIGMLLLNPAARWGLFSGGALLLIFDAVIAAGLSRRPTVDCGCLPVVALEADRLTVALNGALAGWALGSAFAVGSAPDASVGPNETVICALLAALLVTCYWLANYARTVARLVVPGDEGVAHQQ